MIHSSVVVALFSCTLHTSLQILLRWQFSSVVGHLLQPTARCCG